MLRIDGSLFNLLSKIADFVIVNILTVVCSLPIVTIGAALTANYKIMQDIALEKDCTVIKSYFRAFAGNFRQATAVYLLMILAFSVLGADVYIVHNYFNDDGASVMNVLLLVIGFAALGTAAYAFPLIARYDNTIKQHLQNAFLLAFGNLLRTIIILLLYSIPVILGLWSTTVLVESLGLWALFGMNAFLEARSAEEYEAAAQLILEAQARGNRLHITGIGKPGHVSAYMASLFSSTGNPCYFLHGTEAVHGSCGQLVTGDVVICISNSGETAELKSTVIAIKNNGCKVIAVSGKADSWLARESDAFLYAGVGCEGGPLNRAPRNSVLAELITLQVLSVALQAESGQDPISYVRCHPGGALGRLREEER